MTQDLAESIKPDVYRRPISLITFIAAMGVLLPIAAILVELTTGLCKSFSFDPLPTWLHIAMFATIPLANARLVVALHRGDSGLPSHWAWLHAVSFGVAIFYSIIFLPLTPIGIIAIPFFGLGLLALAPLFAVACAMRGRKALKTKSGRAPAKLWQGIALAVAILIAIDSPATATRIGMQMATAESAPTRLRGIELLRAVGSEDLMLRLCYSQTGRATDLLGTILEFNRSIDQGQARTLFYQVTGEAFNNRPAPVRRGMRDWESAFDADRAGEQVGQRVSDVTLVSSRMDGSIDANAALGYLEWTMEFRNRSPGPQEGRAEVALPPGATVSRVTLWINGEEREAAFGGRSQVRAAYEKIVKQSRDPLLVTTSGTDRVLVQLFPIPAGGEMKIRIGITAPMTLDGPNGVQLQLPAFSERNFELDPALRHAVWFESTTPLQGSGDLKAESGPGGLSAVRGLLAEPGPGKAMHALWAPGVRPAALAWSADEKNKDGKVIVQTRAEVPITAPTRVAVVIDGSSSMRLTKQQLVEALGAVPPNIELALVFAGDDAPSLFLRERSNPLPARQYLQGLDYQGGRDSSNALAAAWDWAGQTPGGAIVWIHGPQPVVLGDIGALQQRFERRASQVKLYDVVAQAGPNLIANKLDGIASMARVSRQGALEADLRALFDQWKPGATQEVLKRERLDAGALPTGAKTSTHLARLWAAAEVITLSADPAKRAEAVALASHYQLVTPVSGAVVLETKEQYDEAGLEPVPPGSVPTIPEPETWLLIIVALIVLGMRRRHRAA